MKKALVIGIDAYKGCMKLHGCINDAREIAKLLQKNSDGTDGADDTDNFEVDLVEDVMTKGELIKKVIELFQPKSDIALLYFSGHGDEDYLGYHLVTPDASMFNNGMPMIDIMTIVNRSKAKNKIIILDCCHSAGLAETKEGGLPLGNGITILTSSRADEPSVEVNGHGVFTNLLIEALKGGAADLSGHISPGSIYAYIDKALGSDEQRPVFKTNISNFISLRKVIPQVSETILNNISSFFSKPDEHYPLQPWHEYTNDPNIEHKYIEPYANVDKVAEFKMLQKLQSVGLVVPVEEEHMYWAAMNSKACKLTPLGQHYWRLAKERKIK